MSNSPESPANDESRSPKWSEQFNKIVKPYFKEVTARREEMTSQIPDKGEGSFLPVRSYLLEKLHNLQEKDEQLQLSQNAQKIEDEQQSNIDEQKQLLQRILSELEEGKTDTAAKFLKDRSEIILSDVKEKLGGTPEDAPEEQRANLTREYAEGMLSAGTLGYIDKEACIELMKKYSELHGDVMGNKKSSEG